MSFAPRLAALRALVAAKLRREPKRDGAQRGGADRVSAALVVYSLTRRCRVLGTNRRCEGGNLAALPGVVDEARGIRPLPALIMRPKPSKRPEKARGMASRDVLRRGMGAP